MMRRTLLLLPLVCAVVPLALEGCGTSAPEATFGDAHAVVDAGLDELPLPALPDASTASEASPPALPIYFYAHTDTTLFSIDADHLTDPMVPQGDFDCIGTGAGKSSTVMTDIAVSKTGDLYGVSPTAAYPLRIDTSGSVHCEAVWRLPSNARFYGLTMAPENTVAAEEALIAANGAGELFQIEKTTGKTTQVGTLGNAPDGNPWSLSGDIVFFANNGNPIGFATVRTCPAGSCDRVDTLIEVDVRAIHPGAQSVLKSVRGPVVRGAWCNNPASPANFGSMYGIAGLRDKIYGFSRRGDFIEIRNTDGTGCLVSSNPDKLFAGAGVTTSAPVIDPGGR
jgi:hypothetical protein